MGLFRADAHRFDHAVPHGIHFGVDYSLAILDFPASRVQDFHCSGDDGCGIVGQGGCADECVDGVTGFVFCHDSFP